jgi:putative ABC transport system permease protein
MFDMERAIADWKKDMRRSRAVQDGDVAELEGHLRDKIEDLIGQGTGAEAAFRAAVSDFQRAAALDGDYFRARTTSRDGRPPWQKPRFMPALAWHYLKVMVRKSRRQKIFFVINVGGLALGLAVCLLSVFWVWNEAGYDRFQERLDDIAQVYCDMNYADGRHQTWTGSFYPLSSELKAKSPAVQDACRVEIAQGIVIRRGDKVFTNDRVALADPSFFRIFSFPFSRGNSESALTDRYAAVISESMARKYFGEDDPLGKTLNVNDAFDVTVTGIIRDVPVRSSLRFDCVVSFVIQFAPKFEEPTHWGGNPFQTYVLLRPGVDQAAAASTMNQVLAEHFEEAKKKLTVHFRLLPLSRKHLHEPNATLAPVMRLFALVAAFILFIAWINFMNLSTARGIGRAKEVGIRKAVGGRKSDLMRQFLGESLAFSFIALALALGLTLLLLPAFNKVMGSSVQPSLIANPWILLSAFILAVLSALGAGAYPAFVLARLEPQSVLRAKSPSGPRGSGVLRKLLIIVQFALAGIFTVGMIILDRQVSFIKNADLGYDRHNLVSLILSRPMRGQYETLRTELLRHPSILSITASSQNPININSTVSAVDWEGRDPARSLVFNFDWVGFDYFETLGIPIVQGRPFSREFQADVESGYIVNETAVRMMGMDNPIGRRLSVFRQEGRIVGVAKDFHFEPLRTQVRPFVFLLNPKRNFECFIRIRPGSAASAIPHIRSVFQTLAPGEPFSSDGLFLDDRMMAQAYQFEERIRAGTRVVTVLAVLIACAGLFGLAAYMTERRTKEIGLRKILGASGVRIASELSREFALLVVIADLLALPAAYLLARKFLSGYAYHTPLNWSLFALAAGIAIVIAALTVGSLTMRAARRNPVEALRYE